MPRALGRRSDPLRLVDEFGANYGTWLHEAAHGRNEREVVTHSESKSISCETTFERDLHARTDRAELGAMFTRLCERLAAALERRLRLLGVRADKLVRPGSPSSSVSVTATEREQLALFAGEDASP